MTGRIVKLGKLEINLDELAEFLVYAKKRGYAGGGEEEKLPGGGKRIIIKRGDLVYIDEWDGSKQAPGGEKVTWQRPDGQVIWRMGYSGGMLPRFQGNQQLTRRTFNVLKQALIEVPLNMPFRGPPFLIVYDNDSYLTYSCHVRGNIERFEGYEQIIKVPEYEKLFSTDFSGGLAIPKSRK